MKKFITLLLVLTGMVCTASATKIYFKPNSNWIGQSGSWYAICQQGTSPDVWSKLTAVDGLTEVYSADITLAEGCNKFVFLRMKSTDTSTLNWDNYWDAVLADVPTQNTYCEMASGAWTNWDNTESVTSTLIYDSWIVAGNRHITKGYAEWNTTSEDNTMTSSNGLIYTLTVSGKALKAGTYEYKYYRGGTTWLPSGDENLTLNIPSDGVYNLTFTYDQTTGTQTSAAESTGESATVEYKYYLYEYANSITGNSWGANVMSISDSKASITVNHVSLTKGTTCEYKIVEQVYLNDEIVSGSEYWSYNPSTGNMWSYTPGQSTTCNVTFTYNIPTNYDFTSDNVYVTLSPIENSWYLIVNNGSGWFLGDIMTQIGETYKGIISGWTNGQLFAIAPSSAITSASANDWDWNNVIRPAGESSDYYWITFPYAYGGDTGTKKDNSKYDMVWAVYIGDERGSTAIIYDTNTNKWTADLYIPVTITNGYATFSYKHADRTIAIPDGVTAYYATAADKGIVTMTSITDGAFLSSQAIFLKAANGTYEFRKSDATPESPSTNLLKVGTDSGVAASEGTEYNYVFASQGDEIGFFEVNEAISTDMTGKAYLQTTSSIKPTGNARIAIVFEDESTGIQQIQNSNVNVEGYYNLAGQRVAQPAKGLYIVNGKKVIMK